MAIGSLLAGGIGSILSGGTLGIFGAIGTGVLDFFKTKQANKHELEMIAAQSALIEKQGNSQAALELLKLAGASYENDKATYQGAGMVDTIRGLVRPTLTAFLVAVAAIIALWAFKRVSLDSVTVDEIAKFSVEICLNLASMAVTWWFGSRGIDKIKLIRRK